MKPDAEAVNDEAKLIMHRIIARRIGRDPGMINRALAWYGVWSPEDRALKPAAYWIETLEQGPQVVRRRITQRRPGCAMDRRWRCQPISIAFAT